MRLPFNTTCKIIKGPGSSNPGSLVGIFPCRVVEEDGIHSIGLGAPTIPDYVTLDEYEPVGCWTWPAFGMDSGLGDVLFVPHDSPRAMLCLYTDLIQWGSQAPYYRVYVAYPPPGTLYQGGALINGAATFPSLIRGGVIIDGAAAFPGLARGGVLLDGAAAFPGVARGGVVVEGGSTVYPASPLVPIGGVTMNGAASFTPVFRIYDKFNVSDQTNNGRTPDTTNVPGNTWSNFSGTLSVVSNTLQGTTWSGFNAGSVIDNGQAATQLIGTVTLPNSSSRQIFNLIFRYLDANNYWWGQIEYATGGLFNNTIFLQEILAGVSLTRATPQTVTINHSTAYTMTISDDGNNMSATVNGVSATYSSTSHATSTKVGVMLWSLDNGAVGSAVFDEFKAK